MFEQQRHFDELIRRTDLLVARPASRAAEDAAFEQRYADCLEVKHGRLTVHGIDLHHGGDRPLGTACPGLAGTHRGEHASPSASGLPGGTPAPPAPRGPVDRALAGHDRVPLRGDTGSGKTTLVQWRSGHHRPSGTADRCARPSDPL
ncbi:hypothetical protein J2S47_003802 [Streptomyces griseoviridis]|uniref:Uncharacterized protein n=1 Tax=Streptomyces griseoviridis TaxID=45398 RepID=A0ABT9LJ76_STRGD|nr:hypothetical protein [Streptomyces griseoviridis]MDP9683300.1 hypothetical protein [Streptomyces griseoviridis]GGT12715.1 hypothetical protein GCM10010240_52660 [Streptomyces griseoviridis]